jgi:anti-sigma regulatory factor (Ser/Thr protein kinase)
MPANPSSAPASRLTLESQLCDLARVWPWIEKLSAACELPENTQFAVQLCLEEALSNIIRHGYHNRPGQTVTVDCSLGENQELVLTVEDHAPSFDPLTAPEAQEPIDHLKPGGRGIRLMRKFAGSLNYQRLPAGNRLTLRFTLPR